MSAFCQRHLRVWHSRLSPSRTACVWLRPSSFNQLPQIRLIECCIDVGSDRMPRLKQLGYCVTRLLISFRTLKSRDRVITPFGQPGLCVGPGQPAMAPFRQKICTILFPEASKFIHRTTLTKRLQLLGNFVFQTPSPSKNSKYATVLDTMIVSHFSSVALT